MTDPSDDRPSHEKFTEIGHGFTVIELLFVVVTIGVIFVLLFPRR